ncbi:MAG: oligosaccharide flippase family protein, partial [Planctomycetota bacterium]
MSEPEVGSRVSRLWKHSSVYALGAALGKVASFLLIPLVTSFIGTRANYGVKEIAEVSIVVAGQLLGLNLLHGTTRFWADYENEEDRWRLASTTLWLLALTTGVAALLGTVFSETLAGWLFGSAEFAAALRVTAWILFAQTVGQVGLRVLQVRERSGTYVAITLSKLVLEVGLKVVFLVVLGLTYMGVLYPVLLGEGLLALGTIAFLVKRARFAFSKAMARRLVRYSAPLVLSGLCMFCLHQVDRFFLRTESGLGEVGVYGLAYKLGSIGNALVFEAFALIWFPFVFALKDAAKEREWMRRVIPVISDLSVATALSLSLFGRELVTLVAAPEFHNAWQPMPLILAGYVFWAIYQVVSTPLYLAERTGLVAWIVAGAALVNLALN